jgi:Ca2+/Na+ antiporter
MEQSPDANQIYASRLGEDPGPLRFQYGIIGARLVQLMCAILFGSLLYLASNNLYFLHGMLLLIFFALVLLIMLLISTAKKTPLNANEIYLQLSFYLRQTFYETLNPKIPEADYELMDTSLTNLVPNDSSINTFPSQVHDREQECIIHLHSSLEPHQPDPLSSTSLTDFTYNPQRGLDEEDLVL